MATLRDQLPAGIVMATLALCAAGALVVACAADTLDGPELEITGILTDEGGRCQALRGDDGTLYTLTGDLGDFESGDLVRVIGHAGDPARCDQGETVAVAEITEAPTPGEDDAAPGGAAPPAAASAPEPPGDDEMTDREADQVLLEGELTDEGVECQAFRDADGTLYTLTGDLGGFGTGDRVRIVGTPVEMSTCMQGVTVQVTKIAPLDPAP